MRLLVLAGLGFCVIGCARASTPFHAGDAVVELSSATQPSALSPSESTSAAMAPTPVSDMDPAGPRPKINIYFDENFGGERISIFGDAPTLGHWDRQISSIEVISGTWTFYTEQNYTGKDVLLTPGKYRDVTRWRIPNDSIRSLRRWPLPKYVQFADVVPLGKPIGMRSFVAYVDQSRPGGMVPFEVPEGTQAVTAAMRYWSSGFSGDDNEVRVSGAGVNLVDFDGKYARIQVQAHLIDNRRDKWTAVIYGDLYFWGAP